MTVARRMLKRRRAERVWEERSWKEAPLSKKEDINWAALEVIWEKSMRGQANQAELDLCEPACKADPEEYKKRHNRVRDRAHASMNPLSKKEEEP